MKFFKSLMFKIKNRKLISKVNQVFCKHDFEIEPYYQSNDFADITYYRCKKCKWVGYK